MKYRLLLLLLMIIGTYAVQAQRPSGLPYDTDPVVIDSVTSVIIYIAIPIALIVFYFIWRKRRKRSRRTNQ